MAMLRAKYELTVEPWIILQALLVAGYVKQTDERGFCLQAACMSEDGKGVVLSWADTEREVFPQPVASA